MKEQLWNLRYGHKGFVLSLDVAIAVIVVITILIAANQYVNRSDDSLAKLQMIRTGSDIIAILDRENILDTLNSGKIKEEKDAMLPVNYDMRIKINCKDVDTLEKVPSKDVVGSSERIFVTINQTDINYCTGRFWIWLR